MTYGNPGMTPNAVALSLERILLKTMNAMIPLGDAVVC
jgi:hypothetical protein